MNFPCLFIGKRSVVLYCLHRIFYSVVSFGSHLERTAFLKLSNRQLVVRRRPVHPPAYAPKIHVSIQTSGAVLPKPRAVCVHYPVCRRRRSSTCCPATSPSASPRRPPRRRPPPPSRPPPRRRRR